MPTFFLSLCACIGLLFLTDVAAQETPHFLEKLGTAEGLSSNSIKDMVQDDKGFLWIATADGLNRFDGTEVIQFFHRQDSASLPHNYVFCLEKMAGGYLAVGTQGGLSFYNTNTGVFHNFYYRLHTAMDDYNNTVIQLETDTHGNLWAVSENCIYIFDSTRKLKKIIPSSLTEADAKKQRPAFAHKIIPLSNGDVLIYLYNGLFIYPAASGSLVALENSPEKNELRFLRSMFFSFKDKTEPSNYVFSVFGKYFLCIKPGTDSLLLYNEQGKLVSNCYFPYNKYPFILWSQQATAPDSTRILFLFHNYGMAFIPVAWQHDEPVIHSLSPLLFENYEYATALQDHQHNLWFATTNEGLQKISPYKQYFTSVLLTNRQTGRPAKYETTCSMRHSNKLWTGTYGDGFFETDLSSGRQQQHRLYNTGDDTWANFIWNIRPVSRDTLWIGTQTGLFWYSLSSQKNGRIPAYAGKPLALDSVAITTQFIDSRGLVWMGLGRGKGLCSFNTKDKCFTYYHANDANGYPLRYPMHIDEDSKGTLWFVSDASGLLIFKKAGEESFKTISLPPALQKQVGNFSGLLCDDTVVWLGGLTGGLMKFTPATGKAELYGHEKGLGNSHITGMYRDKERRLWLVTDGELSCFDPRAETFINYAAGDGLPVKYPTASFWYDTVDKRLYNGGQGALFYFDPDKIITAVSPQKALITAMQVNGKPYLFFPDKQAMFRPQQNDITIRYTAIDMVNGPKTKYAYKLIGEDTNWMMAGAQRQINFSRLAPGSYTFMVKTANSNGVWSNEIATASFIIRPPFTQTIGFYALLLLTAGGIFYLLHRFRIRQLLKTELVRSEISRNLHDEVGSALTNISLESLLAQKQLQQEGPVNQLLERIYQDSQHVSQSMREIVWSINPKIDTLGEALSRMLHYASELLEIKNIALRADIAPGIEHIRLSMQQRRDLYLIFKEAVNNMAKHAEATCAEISIRLVKNMLTMCISDNGKGFDNAASSEGNGLKNMNERATSHQWSLEVQSAPGAGTIITLKAQIA